MEIISNIYNELNNRELSILLWLLIIIIFFIVKNNNNGLKNLAKAFFEKHILIIAFCFIVYVLIEVIVLQKIGIWAKSSSKDTVWWVIFTGIFTIGDFKKLETRKSYFPHVLKSYLKFTVILEFLILLNTFNFAIEFLIIAPITTLISLSLLTIEHSKNKNLGISKKLFEIISATLGLILFIYSTIVLFQKIEELDFLKTAVEFLFPICLSLLFIPFVYLIWYYSRIEKLISINQRFFIIPKPSLITLLNVSIILRFNLKNIERWKDQALQFNLTATKDLILEAYRIQDIIKSEKFRVFTPLENGWGIQNSKEFLLEHGLIVGDYKQFDSESEDWSASSNMITLDRYTAQNNIIYHISGEEITVLKLTISASFNTKINPEKGYLAIFSKVTENLFRKAFIMEMPKNILDDIKISKPFHMIILNKRVSFEKDIWSTNLGYHLRFSIENI